MHGATLNANIGVKIKTKIRQNQLFKTPPEKMTQKTRKVKMKVKKKDCRLFSSLAVEHLGMAKGRERLSCKRRQRMTNGRYKSWTE